MTDEREWERIQKLTSTRNESLKFLPMNGNFARLQTSEKRTALINRDFLFQNGDREWEGIFPGWALAQAHRFLTSALKLH